MTAENLQHAVGAFGFGFSLADAAVEGGVPPTALEDALRELLARHAILSPLAQRQLLASVTVRISKNLDASHE